MESAVHAGHAGVSARTARALVLDELFDLTLYRELHKTSKGRLRETLAMLIKVETEHLAFWQSFFELPLGELNRGRRVKLWILRNTCRLFGEVSIHLTLDAIEIYGIRKYLNLWDRHGDRPLGRAVRKILEDELQHEDTIVSNISERRINPERIRSIFLGLNDGLVEILGAVSGFFAAFHDAETVLIASATTTMAGAVSMAAGAFVATASENEVRRLEQGKERFIKGAFTAGQVRPDAGQGQGLGTSTGTGALGIALLVGASYFVGAIIPVLPVALGARSVLASALAATGVIALVSSILAFLSGMRIARRIGTNLAIMAAAVVVAYVVGRIARAVWGVAV